MANLVAWFNQNVAEPLMILLAVICHSSTQVSAEQRN
jgi:hypothetical protein